MPDFIDVCCSGDLCSMPVRGPWLPRSPGRHN